jgi:hypothetical protein
MEYNELLFECKGLGRKTERVINYLHNIKEQNDLNKVCTKNKQIFIKDLVPMLNNFIATAVL